MNEKEIIYIISKGNKWAVRKRRSKRALRLFKYREIAFKYACDIVSDLEKKRHIKQIDLLLKTKVALPYLSDIIISVHNKDGKPDFQYNLMENILWEK